jgi:hypothetical protein
VKIGNKDVASIDIDGKELGLYEDFQKMISGTITTVPAIAFDSITKIRAGAFRACTSLVDITIPEGVTNIDTNSFYGCNGLTELVFPSTLQTGWSSSNICYNCTNLKKITVKASNIASFGAGCFSYCRSLEDFWICTATPPTVQTTTFNNVPSTCILHVPVGSVSAYQGSSWDDYFDDIHGFPVQGGAARFSFYCDLSSVSGDTPLLVCDLLDTSDPTGGKVDTMRIIAQPSYITIDSDNSIAVATEIRMPYSDPAPTVIDLTSLLSDTTGYLKITEVTDAGKEHLYTLV